MKVKIINPTKAIIVKYEEEDFKTLKGLLSYKNTSTEFLLRKHLNNRFWKKSNPRTWGVRLEEIKKEVDQSLLLEDSNGDFYLRPGILPYIKVKFNIEVENCISYPTAKPMAWAQKLEFTPYFYQNDSVASLIEAKHACISLPTGAGKSAILLMLARELGLRTVIVTPSQSIFCELLASFRKHLGDGKVGAYGDGKKDIKKQITICIAKSLTTLKVETPAYEFFKNKEVLLYDESHTTPSATLEKVCHGVLSDVPYRLFVSATQVRNDGTEKMLQSIIGKCVFKMELKEAIEQGYLCPLKFTILKTTSPKSGTIKDPLECKREYFLYNKNIAEIIKKIVYIKYKVGESCLILVEELVQIQLLKEILEIPIAYVHSGSKAEGAKFNLNQVNSQDEIERFNKGETKVLIGTRAIATGTNIFPTHNTFNWMGGSSEIVTKQGPMGRSTRKLELSKYKEYHKPKPFSMIFDFQVAKQPVLDSQLKNRVGFYEETGETVKVIEVKI